MSAFSETWTNAENACFDYLLDLLDATKGKDGFLGMFPLGVVNVWAFGISGGPETELAWSCGSYQPHSWRAEAFLIGLFADRNNALNYVGKVMDSLPRGKIHGATTPQYVQSLRVQRMPSVLSQWFTPANGTRQSLVTEINIPLTVVFDITA